MVCRTVRELVKITHKILPQDYHYCFKVIRIFQIPQRKLKSLLEASTTQNEEDIVAKWLAAKEGEAGLILQVEEESLKKVAGQDERVTEKFA